MVPRRRGSCLCSERRVPSQARLRPGCSEHVCARSDPALAPGTSPASDFETVRVSVSARSVPGKRVLRAARDRQTGAFRRCMRPAIACWPTQPRFGFSTSFLSADLHCAGVPQLSFSGEGGGGATGSGAGVVAASSLSRRLGVEGGFWVAGRRASRKQQPREKGGDATGREARKERKWAHGQQTLGGPQSRT